MTSTATDYFGDLSAHEGVCTWLYCDSRGYVTTGIGNLVATSDVCEAMPWMHLSGEPVGQDEPNRAYHLVLSAFDASKSAQFYAGLTSIRLTEAYVTDLVGRRLHGEFIPGVVRLCPRFESFPLPARRALIDMAYNLGVGGLGRFRRLIGACSAGDWATAAAECHRATCRESRNLWTSQMFIDADVTPPPIA